MSVLVIVVSYNGLHYLADCLGSLSRQDYPDERWDTLLVDNASSDLSLEFVRENFPKVKIIENLENLGFTTANNIGMEKAIKDGYTYVALLNQDTIVEPSWLSELVAVAKRDPQIASVQSKILLESDRSRINTFGNFIHFMGFGFCGYYKYKDGEEFSRVQEITYASGASVLFKSEILQETGFFDDYFFMYHEDLNLGWRLLMSGYKNVVAPASVVYHKYSFSKNANKYYWMERNRYIVVLENYTALTLLCMMPAFVIMEMGLLLFSIRAGFFREKLRAYNYFLQPDNWIQLWKRRRQRQAKRKVTDGLVLGFFSDKLEFEDLSSPLLDKIANPLFSLYFGMLKKIIS